MNQHFLSRALVREGHIAEYILHQGVRLIRLTHLKKKSHIKLFIQRENSVFHILEQALNSFSFDCAYLLMNDTLGSSFRPEDNFTTDRIRILILKLCISCASPQPVQPTIN